MANTHEHLEHAEHAQHHAADPFAMRVAVTMAIVAACLAGIGMVGHRAHNKVLILMGEVNRHLGEANRYRTEAATADVEKSNLFAWYQSKKLRQAQYEVAAETVALMSGADEARNKAIKGWKAKADKYNEPDDRHESLPELIERGNKAAEDSKALKEKAVKARDEAAKVRDDADHVHHQADRLDIAHLLAEVGLVICSIALLTKKKGFWFAGMLIAVLALSTTASAYMIPHHPHPTTEGDSHGHAH